MSFIEEYKLLISLIMILCICICFLSLFILQLKLHKDELELFDIFKGEKDIDIQVIYEDRGIRGEFEVFKVFYKYFNDSACIFNNVKIPKKINLARISNISNLPKKISKSSMIHKRYTETDLIAISKNCIFVVETKNLYGVITGDEKERYWNQEVNDNSNKELYNPISQNRNHIKHLKNNIDLSKYNLKDKNIYSLIVFLDKSNIEKVKCNSRNTKVLNLKDLKETLNSIMKSNDIILNNNQIKEIASQIDEFKNKCSGTKIEKSSIDAD